MKTTNYGAPWYAA